MGWLLGLLWLIEPALWAIFGPRHGPPRTDMNVLGDINPRRN
jgi:hypothetical protein